MFKKNISTHLVKRHRPLESKFASWQSDLLWIHDEVTQAKVHHGDELSRRKLQISMTESLGQHKVFLQRRPEVRDV